MAQSMQTQAFRMGRASRGGFTLVELMIVVSIIGILAALAIYGLQRYQRAAGTGEAVAMLQSIRGAQANYKSENLTFGGCTAAGYNNVGTAVTGADLHPRTLANLDDKKVGWVSSANALAQCFARIGIRSDGPVRFSYGTMAGPPGAAVNPNALDAEFVTDFPSFTPLDPWYIAVAAGDQDNDTTTCANNSCALLSVSSMQNDVYMENDTE